MPNFVPLINGKAYEWADITVNIMGIPIAGIDAVNYEDDQKMTNNYGAGNKPVSRGYGNIESTASITLHAEEINALVNAAPGGRLQNIPEFQITVAFIPEGGTVKVHKLKMCRFMKNKIDTKQGDTKIPCELPLIIGDIQWK
jgi:hypothetical protein